MKSKCLNFLLNEEEIYPIYSLRWQIELDFKNWKSILEIDESSRKLKRKE